MWYLIYYVTLFVYLRSMNKDENIGMLSESIGISNLMGIFFS